MDENRIYSRMFTWLFGGLLITYLSGYCLSMNQELLESVLSVGLIPIVVIELAIAIIMGIRIQKMNPLTTKICYIIYCAVTGITFSTLFLLYELTSIMAVFLVTSILFGLLAVYGAFTKKDLAKFSVLLFVALIGIIIVSFLNIFIFKSSSLEFFVAVVTIVIFLGYVSYDMKAVKYLMSSVGEEKAAVFGAFQLYLDFINIFIRLLELFGKRND